jgi:hypothetical protein
MERVDRMTQPPIVGQFYLVPVVHGKWYAREGDYPVIGSRHNDIEFFDFERTHYHLDFRFVRDADVMRASTAPLHDFPDFPLSKPALKRRKCLRQQHTFDGPSKIMDPFRAAFAGQQCANSKLGWICPHKKIVLGSTPVIGGIVTCPLHGLRIDAETGKCMGVDNA